MYRFALALSAVAFPVTLHAAEKTKPLQVAVELDDKSRLLGKPEFQSIRFQTKEGERVVPLKSLVYAAREKKTWTVFTNKGEEISGQLVSQKLPMKTIVGTVSVPTKYAVQFEIFPTNLGIKVPHRKDLVLYFSFDRKAGNRLRNLARPQHHAVVKGAKWIKQGKRLGAYEFDGNASIEVAHHSALCPKAFTVAAWVYPQENSTPYYLVISKTDGATWMGGYGFHRNAGDGKNLYFYYGAYHTGAAKSRIVKGQWSHIAGVCDGKSVTIYINGEPSKTHKLPPGAVMQHSNMPLVIGGGPFGQYRWKGRIDEVMLYRRALTAKDVEALMAATEKPKR